MSALGPGDLVECVEGYSGGGFQIEKGRIYVCVETARHRALRGHCTHGPQCVAGGIRVREAPTPRGYYWCASSFRPVGEPASDFIAQVYVSEWLGESIAA